LAQKLVINCVAKIQKSNKTTGMKIVVFDELAEIKDELGMLESSGCQ